jgi:hypothetical protein
MAEAVVHLMTPNVQVGAARCQRTLTWKEAAAGGRVRLNAGLGGMRLRALKDDEINDAKSQDSENS